MGLWILYSAVLHSQFYSVGEDPGYLKWEQIHSEHFRIIFPEEFIQEAQRFTNILERSYEINSRPLGHRPKPIPVIVHNHSVISNGFVTWAPKRMEVVTTPSSSTYSQDPLEQLALHEFRHVVHLDKLNQGFTKLLTLPLGEIGIGAVSGLLPRWYLEGDAVDAETRLSFAGRGRLSSWEMELKAMVAENDPLFTYEKAFMGSFKDYVPNHYKYGYQMVAHARTVYGDAIWDSVVTFTARNPYTLYPFYFGLKKYAGSSKSGLYSESIASLGDHWKKQSATREYTESIALNNVDKKHYTNYRFPRYLEDGSVFAEKYGIDQIQEFVKIDSNGNEKRIHRPGFYDPASISVEGDIIAWSEIVRDIRWSRRSYSVIKLFNMDTGLEKILTWKTRYFAPDISRDASMLTTVEADELNKYFLLVIDAESGEVEHKIPSPGNQYLQYPVWNYDHTGIYLTSLGSEGKKIVLYDLESGAWLNIFDAGFENITELDTGEDFLVFRGTFSGIDNIYAINLRTLDCYQVTSSRFGAFMPHLSANGKKILFSDYTSQGFDIHEMNFDPEQFIPIEQVKNHNEQKNRPTKEEELLVRNLSEEPLLTYDTKPYRKFTNLFNLHSWIPFYTDIDNPDFNNPEVSPGAMLFSQNRLSTATTILGYEYRNHDHYLHASFTYTGLYPAFKVSYDYGGIPYVELPPEGVDTLRRVKTNMSLNMEIYFPLNLTMNRYVIGIRPSIESRFSRNYFYYTQPGKYKKGLTFIDYRFYFYNYLKTSKRDILPRFGQTFDLRHVSTPFENEKLGSQTYVSATLYLPGMLRHQTLKINASTQKQVPASYLMSNLVKMPRGFERQTAVQLRKISLDYVFPIWYPDLNVWKAAYFKRLRGGLFFDHAYGQEVYLEDHSNGPVNKHFTSMGAELTTDVHLAHLIFPMNLGARFIYLPENRSSITEFVFSVDLDQF